MRGVSYTYEIRIKNNGTPKTMHKEARNHHQAFVKAKKYGQVLSVRKVDFTQIFGNIEKLDLKQAPLIEQVEGSPYNSAIAMDEMIWNKRNKRIGNRDRDKIDLDK
ncbi:hypothetical protein LCGC14_1714600 [marine sediment metagenome]|uniref:Uncharacterized protein n=1 Tax=marine sediment metagenome TaxID=412755 RepID=A0A0F9HEQ5_9ZZZZ